MLSGFNNHHAKWLFCIFMQKWIHGSTSTKISFFLVFDSDICAERKISHLNLALDHLSPVSTKVINSDCKQQQMISMCIVCFCLWLKFTASPIWKVTSFQIASWTFSVKVFLACDLILQTCISCKAVLNWCKNGKPIFTN